MFRDAWRWKTDDGIGDTLINEFGNRGSVISNCYESNGMESAAELLNAEIIWDYNHVGVLRKHGSKRSPAVTPDHLDGTQTPMKQE